jgi:hypothetical protein
MQAVNDLRSTWLPGLLIVLAVFRGYAFLRHQLPADLLAGLGLALFCGMRVSERHPGG